MKRKIVLISLVLAVTAVLAAGCSDSPKAPVRDSGIDWKDLTDPEDVITNMLLAYENRDIVHYEELLHEDYIWYFQERDAQMLGRASLDFAQDVGATKKLFEKAVMLEIEIDGGVWTEIDKVGDTPCTGCYSTERVYRIQTQFPGNEMIYTGHDHIMFIVVTVDEGGKTKYRIRWAYDIDVF